MHEQEKKILKALAPHAIVVGSAAKESGPCKDIDLVVGAKGLQIAKKVFPPDWESAFIGNIKTFETNPPIEVFRHWYGPDYSTRQRKKRKLIALYGVALRASEIST
jgi:hypothetical protein